MKSVRICIWLCAICLLATPVVFAQNGAVVTRGDDLYGWYDWNGENVLAIQSSEIEFFCFWPELSDVIWLDWIKVLRPDGTLNYHDKGDYFTRVFFPATPDDFDADPCALWNNAELMVAEGITHTVYLDNHVNAYDVPHNRRNVYGYNVTGKLYDTAGLCSTGMIGLKTVRRSKLDKDFPACWPDDCESEVQAWKGPDLNCN